VTAAVARQQGEVREQSERAADPRVGTVELGVSMDGWIKFDEFLRLGRISGEGVTYLVRYINCGGNYGLILI
jgi:hypothetical protein